MTVRDREVVCVVPLGDRPPARELINVADALESGLGLTGMVGKAVGLPDFARHAQRGQYNSSAVLRSLASEMPSGATRVLGVTRLDLYVPGMNFVFGEAEVGGDCAVISLCRLREEHYGRRPDNDLLASRAAKEGIHEVGHMLELTHCPDGACVMRFSNTLADTDRKGRELCPACREKLGLALGKA